ncbi:pericardin [Carabus blaptoides fortunei]
MVVMDSLNRKSSCQQIREQPHQALKVVGGIMEQTLRFKPVKKVAWLMLKRMVQAAHHLKRRSAFHHTMNQNKMSSKLHSEVVDQPVLKAVHTLASHNHRSKGNLSTESNILEQRKQDQERKNQLIK